MHLHQMPCALQLFPCQFEMEAALLQFLGWGFVGRRIRSAVPYHDRAAAVIARRNGPFEIDVRDGMILHLHGEAFLTFFKRDAFGNGPGFQDPFHLQPKIVMQTGGGVFLDDEAATGAGSLSCGRFPGLGKIPFPGVFLERHGPQAAFRRALAGAFAGADFFCVSRMLCCKTETRSMTLPALRGCLGAGRFLSPCRTFSSISFFKASW